MLMDYDASDREATSGGSLGPKLIVEVANVGDWHGKGRAFLYQHAFVVGRLIGRLIGLLYVELFY
jgi:hypothetical protein